MGIKVSVLRKPIVITAFSVAALLAAPLAVDYAAGPGVGMAVAHAAEGGQGGKGHMGGGGSGHGAGGPSAGHGGSSMDKVLSGEDSEGEGQKGGQHGPSDESDAKGPKYGGGHTGETNRGKPVWAQEGIPEVELGRLSVARSPQHVLDRSLIEALASVTTGMESFYSLTASQAATELKDNYDSVVRIDSPLQNLALYQQLLKDGSTDIPNVTPASRNDLAAIFLGTASDKTMAVTPDTVKAVSIILGVDKSLTAADVNDIATKAEEVRQAIAEGHGE
jgi:hypothetical protein